MGWTVGDVVDVIRRSGGLDPLRSSATLAAAAWHRAGPATPWTAGLLRHPHRLAVIDAHGAASYLELHRHTEALAARLADLVDDDDAVGLLCGNHRGFVEAHLAASKAGVRVVYLNTGTAAPSLAEVVSREGVTVVVCDPDHLTLAAASGPGVTRLVVDPTCGGPTSEVKPSARARPVRTRRAPSPVLLTSGTTGPPKGARRSGGPDLSPLVAAEVMRRLPYRTADRVLVAPPLFHAFGLMQLNLTAGLGGTVVLPAGPDPESVLEALDAHRPSVLAMVPIMFRRLLEAVERGHPVTHRPRLAVSSGSSLSPEVVRRWGERFGPTLHDIYGSTECGVAAIATPADLAEAPGSVGRPPVGVRVRIVDDDGVEVPVGRRGRITVRGPGQTERYTGGPRLGRIGDALLTGDIGRLDDQGRLWVEGRADDMIISGGENVHPRPVEELLAEVPGIDDVAVVGVPDPDFGQRLCAVVVAEDGAELDPDELRATVRRRLGRHLVPRDVIVTGAIPRTPSGKVIRHLLVI